jgi:rhodanese-related sulfurtransferase
MSKGFPTRPKSFTHIISTNMKGTPLLERCPLERSMPPDEFEKRMGQGAVVIDSRDSAAFCGFHIPGSLNIGFEKQLANLVGMVIEPQSELLLVVNSKEAYDAMCIELHRIGYDKIIGYIEGGIEAWVYAGKRVETLAHLSVHDLKRMLDSGSLKNLVDVRNPGEWNQGHISQAVNRPLAAILDKGLELPKDDQIAINCSIGYRTNIVASLLKQKGYANVQAVVGGTFAWSHAGFDLVQ